MALKIENYKQCTKCGVERNTLSLLSPCPKGGSHAWCSKTRWI